MLSLKVLVDDHGWRAGRVLAKGSVALGQTGEVIPPGRIRAVVHYPREQTPHEAPRPEEIGWLVLVGAVFFEGKRAELEAAAWPDWRDPVQVRARAALGPENGVLRAAATLSAVLALAVTTTNGSLALAPTAVSGVQGGARENPGLRDQ